MLTLVGHCYHELDTVPFHPFLEMLETAARIVPARNFREAMSEDASEVAKIMPQLRRIFDDIPEPLSAPPGDERRYLLDHVRRFVERAAHAQPMLLVFEDLHWADESSVLLL